jgi:hypothetical protein
MPSRGIAGLLLMLSGLAFAGIRADAADDDSTVDMAPLVRMARRYGVPMPHKGPRLVYARVAAQPDVYSPAFLLEERPNGSIVVLRGLRQETLNKEGRDGPVFVPFVANGGDGRHPAIHVDFQRRSTFLCAIQCAARGDEATAQALVKQLADVEQWSDAPWDHFASSPAGQAVYLLGKCLLERWRSDFMQTGAEPRALYRKITALGNEDPRLKDEVHRYFLVGILAALYTPSPKAGSTEALLLEWARQPPPRSFSIFDDFDGCHVVPVNNRPARKIVLRGFASVPDLLALLFDERPTAHWQGPNSVKSVGDLADDLLGEISGEDGDSDGYDERMNRFDWWERVRGKNEMDSYANSAFQRERKDASVPDDLYPKDRHPRPQRAISSITGVHEGPVRILAAKDPSRLIPLLAEFVKKAAPDAQPFALAEALVDSNLPRTVKENVLVEYSQQGSLENRRSLLQILAKLNPQKCAEIVVPILQALPKDATGPYWTCPEASFSHVVMECENDAVWRELLAAAKRSVVGLRLQYMDPMDYSYIRDRNRSRRIAFLAAFLDDAEVRRLPPRGTGFPGDWRGKFSGPCAAFTFPEIEVRNYAAMELACVLDLCDSPEPKWTAAQWTALRAKVKARLAKENLPNLEATGSSARK